MTGSRLLYQLANSGIDRLDVQFGDSHGRPRPAEADLSLLSGDPAPSAADLTITKLLREASKNVEIDLLDHVIIGTKDDDPLGRGHFSFRDAGLL